MRKRTLWRRFKKFPSRLNGANYRKYATWASRRVFRFHEKRESLIVDSKNPKKIARHVKNRLNYDPGIETLTNSEGIVSSDPAEKAEVLAKQFASVFTRDDGTLPTCEDMDVINLRECEFDPLVYPLPHSLSLSVLVTM